MEVKFIGIDTKSPLDIHNFLNLEGIKIIPSNNLYIINFDTKLYLSNDIVVKGF